MTNKHLVLLYDPIVLDHRPSYGHPERPEQTSTIIKTLQDKYCGTASTHVVPLVRLRLKEINGYTRRP